MAQAGALASRLSWVAPKPGVCAPVWVEVAGEAPATAPKAGAFPKILWKTRRSPDFNKGSMILVDGLILGADGATKLYLIEPDPSGYKQLASAELLAEAGTGTEGDGMASRVGGRTQNWAPIALSDGKLLIRDQKQLKCVKVGQ